MKIFKCNSLDAVYWFDVDQYHKEHPEAKRVYVWHGDAMAIWTFNVIKDKNTVTMRLGAYLANGNFVFHDGEGNAHYVFKDSTGWSIWREMNEQLDEQEADKKKENNV